MISPALRLVSCIIHLTSALTSVHCQPSSVIVSPESNSFTLPARFFLTATELTPQKHHHWPNFAPFPCFQSCVSVSTLSSLYFQHSARICARVCHMSTSERCHLHSSVCRVSASAMRCWFHRQICHSRSPAAMVRSRTGSHTRLENKTTISVHKISCSSRPSIRAMMETPDPNQVWTLKLAFESCEEKLKGAHFPKKSSLC